MKTTSKWMITTAMIFTFFSCQTENENPSPQSFIKDNASATVEKAAPEEKGKLVEVKLDGEMVQMERVGDLLIYEGDMVFTTDDFPGQVASNKSVGLTTRNRWSNATIYYSINSAVSHRQADIEWAAQHITNNTDLTVKVRTSESNYVEFISSGGCWSYVGMIGGQQSIGIANGCGRGSIVHELLHAAGVMHEHSRSDRDDYVTINWENIQDGREGNFNKVNSNYTDFTTGLDFNSIMMYWDRAFSKNGQKTIERKDGKPYYTQRSGLSTDDIQGLNQMY